MERLQQELGRRERVQLAEGALGEMNPRQYTDYTRLGLTVVITDHARNAIVQRGMARDDVIYVLQVHDVDLPGDQPHKRELIGPSSRGKIKVVVALHPEAGEIRVVTVHQEPRRPWRPRLPSGEANRFDG